MTDHRFPPVLPDAGAAQPSETTDMVRSEERMQIRTETIGLERVRLQRYIVTEERTVTVTVRREEVRVIREPLDGRYVPEGVETGDSPVMVLSEERVVVDTEIVPVERVWLRKERVVEQHRVSDVIRGERIELVRDA